MWNKCPKINGNCDHKGSARGSVKMQKYVPQFVIANVKIVPSSKIGCPKIPLGKEVRAKSGERIVQKLSNDLHLILFLFFLGKTSVKKSR